jgi:vitamin B12 transporter
VSCLSAQEIVIVKEVKINDALTYHEVETVIVTANRSPTSKKQIAENVSVFTKEDIQKTSARDLGEVLRHIPAVDVQLNGQFGQATALSINGSSSRQVLLMVDGTPFNTQLSGQANPSQIPIEHIERIEVIKGAASSVWGSSLGGVINVITKDVGDSAQPTGSLTSSFAEFGTTKNSLDLAGKVKNVGYFVSGSYLDTDGPQAISDVEEKKLFGKLQLPVGDDAKLVGSFGYNQADARYALATSSNFTAQPYQTRYGSLQFNVDKGDYQWHAALKYNDQKITTDIVNVSSGSSVSTTISSNLYKGLSLNGSMDMHDYGLVVMGIDLDFHTLKSNKFLDRSKDIKMQAPYANHTFQLDNWDLITGVRYDHNDQFGAQTSPSFGVVYHFTDANETLVHAKVSRGFNAPPLLWIYSDDAALFVGANPDLKAERSVAYDIGLETHLFSSVDVDLNFYRADVRDAIGLVFDNNNFVFVQQNFRKFRRQGGEVLLNYKVMEDLTLYSSAGFNDVKNKVTGQRVRNQGIARQKFTFGAHYKNKHDFGVNLSGYYNRFSSSPSLQPNDRKPIFDLKLTKEFKDIKENVDIETFLNIHNLTNSKYWSSISFPLPKRYFEGGLSVKF